MTILIKNMAENDRADSCNNKAYRIYTIKDGDSFQFDRDVQGRPMLLIFQNNAPTPQQFLLCGNSYVTADVTKRHHAFVKRIALGQYRGVPSERVRGFLVKFRDDKAVLRWLEEEPDDVATSLLLGIVTLMPGLPITEHSRKQVTYIPAEVSASILPHYRVEGDDCTYVGLRWLLDKCPRQLGRYLQGTFNRSGNSEHGYVIAMVAGALRVAELCSLSEPEIPINEE